MLPDILARQDDRREDIISLLWSTQIEGKPMTLELMEDYAVLLFIAGLDTVINGMGFGIRHLAMNPDLQDRLRADPSQITEAAEELLRRYSFTIPMRRVAKDTELGGWEMKAGEWVALYLPGADLDPREFPSPKSSISHAKTRYMSRSGLARTAALARILRGWSCRSFIRKCCRGCRASGSIRTMRRRSIQATSSPWTRCRSAGIDFGAGPPHGRGMTSPDTLARLEAVIAQRSSGDPAASYVAKLHSRGIGTIAQKLGEEAIETVIAAITEDRAALVGEAADLLFHLLVLLGARDVPLAEVLAELDRREGISGIAEKAARSR